MHCLIYCGWRLLSISNPRKVVLICNILQQLFDGMQPGGSLIKA